ncbi:MAG TPA: ATP-binding protein, partial [Bacteroidales bacterium]|nr:ATP-binding protein [Bacteroidales bacterium]
NGSVCMISDITEVIKVGSDLKKTRRRLENALKTGNIGTWEFNSRSGEISWDKRTQEIFKTQNLKVSIENVDKKIHEDDFPHVKQVFSNLFTTGENGDAIFRTRPVSGKCNYVLAKAIVHKDRKGRSTGMSGVVFDVTDMKEGAERTLIELNEALLKSNSDLQQFAYVASHDLQEPLRMVSSFTQLLQQKYHDRLDEDANEYIHYAVEGSKRMYELINSLLAYSRVQSRARESTLVNMNSIVEKVIANLNLIITEKDALIEYGHLPTIFADSNQMIQLMQNLIENGLKFSNGKPHITIACQKKKNHYIFSVKDKGIGIEPQYFERIFRIFQKLHSGEQYPGTGIGLAICKRIIDRHGGRIWVNSEPGSGSEFFFSIPGI